MSSQTKWPVSRLGDIAEIAIGGTPSRSNPFYWDPEKKSKNRWASIADLKGRFLDDTAEYISDLGVTNSSVKPVPPGTVVMSFKLSIGRTALTRNPLFTNEAIAAFFPKQSVLPQYLLYALPSAAATGSADVAVKGLTLNKGKLFDLEIPLPSLIEQRRIAAILSSLDDSIESSSKAHAALEVVRDELTEFLLTNGMPNRHLSYRIESVGPVPEAWTVSDLNDLCERISVGIVVRPASYYTEGGIPCLRSKNVRKNRIDLSDVVHISPESNEALAKSKLKTGDVVTVRTGEPGTSCVVPADLDGANCIDLIITTPGPQLSGSFLARFLNSKRGRATVLVGQGGLAQQHFNVGAMKKVAVPVPSRDEQGEIVAVLESIDCRVRAESSVRDQLLQVKAALMGQLLSGELRVTSGEVVA